MANTYELRMSMSDGTKRTAQFTVPTPTAEEVGARPSDWMPTAEEVGARPSDWMPSAEEVGARPNTWLPTIAEIGAAPAGYGLGGNGTLVPASEIDSIKKNGWYVIASDVGIAINGIVYTHALLECIVFDANASKQILHPLFQGGMVLERYCEGNIWGAWKTPNPRMDVGTEYLTTELWYNKPVYAKLVNLGTLPNGTQKSVSVVDSNGDMVVSAHFVFRMDDGWTNNNISTLHASVHRHQNGWLYVDITASNDLSGYTQNYALVKYTKTTD